MNRLQFYFKSQTAHGLHSPSIYALYCDLLNPFLKGLLTEQELKQKLVLLYPEGNVMEMNEHFDPAAQDQNTIVWIKKPYRQEAFWNSIKSHPAVIQTVDLYDFGMVFFKPICPKQNFYLRKM